MASMFCQLVFGNRLDLRAAFLVRWFGNSLAELAPSRDRQSRLVRDMNQARRPYWRSFRAYWYWVVIAALLILQWVVYPPVPSGPAVPTGPPRPAEGGHKRPPRL